MRPNGALIRDVNALQFLPPLSPASLPSPPFCLRHLGSNRRREASVRGERRSIEGLGHRRTTRDKIHAQTRGNAALRGGSGGRDTWGSVAAHSDLTLGSIFCLSLSTLDRGWCLVYGVSVRGQMFGLTDAGLENKDSNGQ
uniref:Uncharacterized protein n=1 Tax=Knipowitschia caucasica TaxID=637954 RepID=A0AAV2JG67_KNICA